MAKVNHNQVNLVYKMVHNHFAKQLDNFQKQSVKAKEHYDSASQPAVAEVFKLLQEGKITLHDKPMDIDKHPLDISNYFNMGAANKLVDARLYTLETPLDMDKILTLENKAEPKRAFRMRALYESDIDLLFEAKTHLHNLWIELQEAELWQLRQVSDKYLKINLEREVSKSHEQDNS